MKFSGDMGAADSLADTQNRLDPHGSPAGKTAHRGAAHESQQEICSSHQHTVYPPVLPKGIPPAPRVIAVTSLLG
jgi:hypothetical protein